MTCHVLYLSFTAGVKPHVPGQPPQGIEDTEMKCPHDNEQEKEKVDKVNKAQPSRLFLPIFAFLAIGGLGLFICTAYFVLPA